jgi:hypothetical protein
VDQISYGEARLYQDKLIQCQSDQGHYVCSSGRVDMSGGDGIDSSTRVPLIRHMWAPMVTSYLARY